MPTRPCRPHRSLLVGGVVCAVLMAIAAPVAEARQDSGSLPQQLVSSTAPLTAAQRQQVEAFVETWIRALNSGDPVQVARGRVELAQPPGRPGATPAFHRDYASIVRPRIDPIIDGDDELRAINALIVLRSLRTPESVERLAALTAPRTERRAVVRVRSAGLLVDAVADAPLSPAQVDSVARAVAEAASTDPEWVASYHGFRTLARIAGRSGLPPGSVTLALESQVAVIRRLVERAEREAPPSEAVQAIARSLIVARDQLPTLSPDNATTLRRGLAGSLARLATLAEAHWEGARESSDGAKAYGDAMTAANLLLRLEAGARQRPLAIDLGAKWRADDRSGFSADVAAAQALASAS